MRSLALEFAKLRRKHVLLIVLALVAGSNPAAPALEFLKQEMRDL